MFLPSDSHTTLFFLQQVITGQKRAKKQSQIALIKVPLWPELSVAKVWPDAIQIPGFLDWMPDEWHRAKRVDRKFFWAILQTEHPTYVEHLIRGAQNARALHKQQQLVQPTYIQPTPEWMSELLKTAGFVSTGK